MELDNSYNALTLMQWAPSDRESFRHKEFPFKLSTCQREIVLFFRDQHDFDQHEVRNVKILSGRHAYRHLLEVVCGLKSRLIGETEIVAQFRQAYADFDQSEKRCSTLMKILDRVLMDSKQVRTNHLKNIGQYSYAGLTKALLKERNAHEVVIFGSGNLANDLAKILAKKFKLIIVARNKERMQELADRYENIETRELDLTQLHQFTSVPFLVNTIGLEDTLFSEEFFSNWQSQHQQKLFIDLAQPSPLATQLGPADDVFRLDHLFLMAEEKNKIKLSQVAKAHLALDQIIAKRYQNSSKKKESTELIQEEIPVEQTC